MFESLRIRNGQCHTDLTLDLNRPVTTIAGPSDRGKSAVLRLLRWVCQNKPAGDGLRRHGAKSVKAGLVVDGHKLLRAKGKANTYTLDGNRYAAVGTSVPDPVANLLRVEDFNFGGQHDAAFWFSCTAGQVSRELNRIVNLDAIDRVMGELLARKRKAGVAEEVAGERLKTATATKEAVKAAPGVGRDLAKLQALEEQASFTEGRLAKLLRAIDAAKTAAARHKRLAGAARAAAGLSALRGAAEGSRGRQRALDKLLTEMEGFRTAQRAADESRVAAEDELRRVSGGRCPLCGGNADAEEWRDVIGYEGHYQVSDLGRVKALSRKIRKMGCAQGVHKPERFLSMAATKKGYLVVRLCNDGEQKSHYVHRLVLETFVGPCPQGMQCRHVHSNDRSDNRLHNLQWGTPKQNQADRKIHGTDNATIERDLTNVTGSNNHFSKLTEPDVIKIRAMRRQGVPVRDIAKEYKIDRTLIYMIEKRTVWKHV